MSKFSIHQVFYKAMAVLLVLAFAVGTAGVPVAHAAGFTVTNLDDSGAGSLRKAILDAAGTPGADTITFSVSGTITLASSLIVDDAAGLTIDGLGQSITINGNDAVQVMGLRWGSALTIRSLTIANGNGGFENHGGGIFNGGTLVVENSTFTNNSAVLGGGIVNGGLLTINNSTFSGNTANNGGGVVNNFVASATIKNSIFSGNTAGDQGSGIYNEGGTLTVENSTFSGNNAITGSIYNVLGTLIVSNSTFSNNTTINGGGIVNIFGPLTVGNSTFSGNSGIGGGIFNDGGVVTVTDSTFSDNNTDIDGGGGIFNFDGSMLTVSNSTFSGNSAPNGGGIYNDFSTLIVKNSTFFGNSTSGRGGAIANFEYLTVENSTLSGNSAEMGGGGIYSDSSGTGTLRNTIVANNLAGGNCGGTFINGGGNLVWGDSTCPGINADPKLLPLADNGGPTQTMALDAGSAAIDAVLANCPAADQRGVSRPQGAGCDIGAFELEPASDITAPTISLTTPADGAVYLLGQALSADYACQDEDGGSGVASCVGSVANGSPIDTSSVGPKSFTVNAADNAGNPASATHNYSVVYNFSGFFQPVDNLPILNTVRGGAGIAVKFSLGGNQGLNILAAGSPGLQRITCDSGAAQDDIEQTVTAGASTLSYDATSNTYSYTWKTERAWAGTCRQLIVKLSDGTEHQANFKFK